MRISRIARYTTSFVRPTVPHAVDDNTIALYRFDEGSGIIIGDSAVGGISVGELKPRIGGAAQHWSNDIPFTTETIPTATYTATPTPSPKPTYTATPISTPRPSSTAIPIPSPTIVNVPATTTPTLPIRIYIPLIFQARLATSTLQSGVASYD